MKTFELKFNKIINFFKDLLGIKPTNGIAALKKKYGIFTLVEKSDDYMKFLTRDAGYLTVKRADVTNGFSVKATELTIKKEGGAIGLNGIRLGEHNAVEGYHRSRFITNRPYTDYSTESPRNLQLPHMEVWNSVRCRGHFTMDCKSTPLQKSLYKRFGFSSADIKIQ